MKNIIPFIISIVVLTTYVTYISVSEQVKSDAVKSEATIVSSAQAFLDIVSDKGAINTRDYAELIGNLTTTGAMFDVSITVTRPMPVPDPANAGQYIMEYQSVYGWHSSKGGLGSNYVDPNWTDGNAPKGVQYLKADDFVSLVINQTDAMNYQRTMVSRMSLHPVLGKWSYGQGVRNTGSSMTQSQ